MNNIEITEKLINFIKKSPTAFHAVDEISSILINSGFTALEEGNEWNLERGRKYFVTRNRSSIIAFALPTRIQKGSFLVTASHTDSPTFKLKGNAESETGPYVKLNVEGYGGMILSTWLDRPLTVAGRVVVKENNSITTKLIHIDRDLCLIPNVPIHHNRKINDGYAYNMAVDMMPLFGMKESEAGIDKLIADYLGVREDEILARDLYLCPRTPAAIWGTNREFFSGPRIDNLQCAYGTLTGFVNAIQSDVVAVPVYSSFDNEETGSGTKQGAASTFLRDILERICGYLGWNIQHAIASSFMISADNAHARHPNHPELSDTQNSPIPNGSVLLSST